MIGLLPAHYKPADRQSAAIQAKYYIGLQFEPWLHAKMAQASLKSAPDTALWSRLTTLGQVSFELWLDLGQSQLA